jgi:hypothetical protein
MANFIEKERLYCRYITTTNFYLALLVETYFKLLRKILD